jgi:hypothetical protein
MEENSLLSLDFCQACAKLFLEVAPLAGVSSLGLVSSLALALATLRFSVRERPA